MMPGDIPCNAHCENTLCPYCIYGLCVDNAPCEERLPRPESNDSETEN